MFQEPENLFSPLLILNAKGKYESVLLLSFYYLGDGCTMNSVSWSVLRTYNIWVALTHVIFLVDFTHVIY